MKEPRKIYIAVGNTDLTEGRGGPVPVAVSTSYSQVLRLGNKKYVMGANCPIREVETIIVEGKEYFPIDCVYLLYPTKEDQNFDKARRVHQSLVEKAKELGMSDEDIKTLLSTNL